MKNNNRNKEKQPDDITFDGRDNFYQSTGIFDITKSNSLHIFSGIALLHDSKNKIHKDTYKETHVQRIRKPLIIYGCIVITLLLIFITYISILNINNIKHQQTIMKVTNISKDNAEYVNSRLHDNSIFSLQSIKPERNPNHKSSVKIYRIKTSEIGDVLLYLNKDGSIKKMTNKGKSLYDEDLE